MGPGVRRTVGIGEHRRGMAVDRRPRAGTARDGSAHQGAKAGPAGTTVDGRNGVENGGVETPFRPTDRSAVTLGHIRR
jgi:hypothetical protein